MTVYDCGHDMRVRMSQRAVNVPGQYIELSSEEYRDMATHFHLIENFFHCVKKIRLIEKDSKKEIERERK